MSSPTVSRSALPDSLGLATAAAGATWVALFSWREFTEDAGRFLVPLLFLGAVLATVGAVARWARWHGALVLLAQLIVTGALLSLGFGDVVLPTESARQRIAALFEGAVETAVSYSAPVPAGVEPGVHPLLVVGGVLAFLAVDVLACTLRRAPLAGLPLLVVYSLPVSMLGLPVSGVSFVAAAAGFLCLLFVDQALRRARWGRPLWSAEETEDPAGMTVRRGAVRTSATVIGGTATAIALVVPLLVPTLDLAVFGRGGGAGDGQITIENPMVDLRRRLSRGADLPLMRVETTDPHPAYLRIAVLNRFSESAWTSGDRSIPEGQVARGVMPAPQGVDPSVPRTEAAYRLTATDDFESIWLPTPHPVSRIDAAGTWKYDLRTMDFVASERGLTTAGLSYTATAVSLQLDAAAMAAAESGVSDVSLDFSELPDDLPPMVSTLAGRVTAGAPSRFEKAVALQEWFRRDGGFTYDLDAPPGNGADALVSFLSEGEDGRTGYCEQFASAMAVMARTLGIPTRVAVGFLRPRPVSPGVWEYSAHDLHAWPELYFPGSGWVRFEPTPAGRASGVPGYTTQAIPRAGPSDGPTVDAQPNPAARPSVAPRPSEADSGGTGEGASAARWGWVGGGAGAALMLGLVLLVPRTVRRLRRQRRWREPVDAETAWAELRDTVTDLGRLWPRGLSPRATRDQLVRLLAPAPPDAGAGAGEARPGEVGEAGQALDRVVLTLERQRYAADAGRVDRDRLRRDVELVTGSLAAGASPAARRRAQWWPASVTRLRERGAANPSARRSVGPSDQVTVDRAVDRSMDRVG